jgi:hypothetical protein
MRWSDRTQSPTQPPTASHTLCARTASSASRTSSCCANRSANRTSASAAGTATTRTGASALPASPGAVGGSSAARAWTRSRMLSSAAACPALSVSEQHSASACTSNEPSCPRAPSACASRHTPAGSLAGRGLVVGGGARGGLPGSRQGRRAAAMPRRDRTERPPARGRDAVTHSIRDAVRHAERWQSVRCQGRCRAGLGGNCPAGRKDWESCARKARSSVEGVLQKFCGAESVQLALQPRGRSGASGARRLAHKRPQRDLLVAWKPEHARRREGAWQRGSGRRRHGQPMPGGGSGMERVGGTRRVRAKRGAARPVERAARDRPRSAPALRAGWAALSCLSPQAAAVGSPAPRLPPPAPPPVLLPRRVHAAAPPGPAPPDLGRCFHALPREAAAPARERWAAGEQRLARKPCCRLWCRRPRPRARGCSRTWRYLPSATSLLCRAERKRMPPLAL